MAKQTKPNPVGRPPAYNPGLIKKANDYIINPDINIPNIAGLSLAINVGKSTLEHWKTLTPKDLDQDKYPRFEEFQEMLAKLKAKQEDNCLEKGATGAINSTISKLVLAKHGYSDKIDVTSGGEAISPAIVMFCGDEEE